MYKVPFSKLEANLLEILTAVDSDGTTFVVKHNGKELAAIIPMSDLDNDVDSSNIEKLVESGVCSYASKEEQCCGTDASQRIIVSEIITHECENRDKRNKRECDFNIIKRDGEWLFQIIPWNSYDTHYIDQTGVRFCPFCGEEL